MAISKENDAISKEKETLIKEKVLNLSKISRYGNLLSYANLNVPDSDSHLRITLLQLKLRRAGIPSIGAKA